jgi:hypothetical protein
MEMRGWRIIELPRAERYTEQGQKRLRAMWRFYLLGLPVDSCWSGGCDSGGW